MRNSNESGFWFHVWRLVWPDIRSFWLSKTRIAIEAVVVVPIAWFILRKVGTDGAAWDYWMEKYVAIPIAVVALFVVHVAWSLLTVPWRLYCEQQQKLDELSTDAQDKADRIAALESRPQPQTVPDDLKKDLLEIERLKLVESEKEKAAEWNRFMEIRNTLQKHADAAPIGDQFERDYANVWVNNAQRILERTIIQSVTTNFHQ